MKIKKFAGPIVLGAMLICFAAAMFNWFRVGSEVKCGTILHKVESLHLGKYSAHTEAVLVVDFSGVVLDIKTTWGTYMSKNVGDRVCFNLSGNDLDKVNRTHHMDTALIFILAAALIGVISIIVVLIRLAIIEP